MATFHPPENFDFMRPAGWPEWRERFDRYRKGSKLYKEDEGVQRAKFYNRHQKVEQFHRSLHDLASTCSFENLEEAVRDRLVIGLLDKEVAQKLQLEDLSKVTLKYAVDTARHYELVKEQQTSTSTASVNAVSRSTPHSSKQRGRGGAYKSSRGHNNSRGNSHFQPQRGQNSRVSSCGNCGYQHAKQSQCPARGKTCRKCNKQNHFARVCRSSKNINEVETFFTEAVTEENEEVFFMGSVFDINNVRQEAEPPWFVDINQCGLSTIFKIDTGADVSMVSRNIPVNQKLCPKPKLTRSNAILRGPGGLIHHEGQTELDRLEKADIIHPIEEPTDWCAPIVPVLKKDGSNVRITTDFKELNKAIKRERYHIPTLKTYFND
ncbi:hypothetical protein RRG08_043144 [Elysia crispata]|uniref:Peptidase A2 domain-containing protein n=1 Tax=Elysia crispata TaxID=231223 RepID=A0AAE1D056_9GAST|nr:hypothetical protein RRG08_043144 [Elysia crispata]